MKRSLLLTIFTLMMYWAYSQNLYTHANAASTSNEQNSVSGWTGPADIESEDDDPKSGEYCIKIESDDEDRHGQFSYNAVPGNEYTITIWARRGQSSNSEFDEWEGFANFQKRNITGQGWKEYVFTLTATSDHPIIRVFASKNPSDEREVFVDAITIYEIEQGDTQAPTAPANLNASNITSTSFALTWSPSTDNVGVTGYRIFQNNNNIGQVSSPGYQVTGLTPSTNYSYYVKAYDAEGNTSQASNSITVTTGEEGSGGGGGSGGGSGLHYTNENSNLPTVNWQALNFYSAGTVGIGTAPSNQFRLAVNGTIRAKEVIVETGWSDFVFDPGYRLPSLSEVELHIQMHGHLKDIPSAEEVAENGVQVGEINKLLLQKLEELTLYMIDANKEIQSLKKRIEELEGE